MTKAVKVTPSDSAYITTKSRYDIAPATAVLATSLTVASDLIGSTAHGMSNGDTLTISDAGTSDLSTSTTYFVINKNANDFQIALTFGGSAVNIGGTNTTPPTYVRRTSLTAAFPVSGYLYVGGAGVVNALPADHHDTDDPTTTSVFGGAVLFTAVAGGYLPVKIKKVFNTSTTATLMVLKHE